jgi:uncharacterized protein (TIGR03382 family)
LSEGRRSLQVVSDDGYGGQASSAVTIITVDTLAPAAPVITAPAPGVALLGGTVTFSGTAEPGSSVQVSVDGQAVCTAVTDAQGSWTCNASGVPAGGHQVSATATDATGNVSGGATGTAFSNKTSLTAPTVSGPMAASRIEGPGVSFSGMGIAGTTVTVTDDLGVIVCTATVTGNGAWDCRGDEHAGEHTVTATLSWNDVTSPASAPRAFTVFEKAKMSGGGCSSTTGGPQLLVLLLGLALLRRRQR